MGRVLVQQPGTNTAKALSETLPKNVIIVDEDLQELRLHDGVTPGGKIIGQSAGAGVPVGTIIPFAGNAIPQGYLLCDGSAISRTDYASLFAIIGTIYGAGDGNSTFNLPNLVRHIPWYDSISTIGRVSNGGLPSIAHTHTGTINTRDGWGGWHLAAGSSAVGTSAQSFTTNVNSAVSGIYGASNTVVPAHVKTLYCIKYI